MALIIQNEFFCLSQDQKCGVQQQSCKLHGKRMIWSFQQNKAYSVPKKEGTKVINQCVESSLPSRFYKGQIESHIFLQCTSLGFKIRGNMIKDGKLVRLQGGCSLEILKLFTRCNNSLPFDGFSLMLDNRTGLLEIHSNQVFTHNSDQNKIRKITIQLIKKIAETIGKHMAVMFDLVGEGFHLEAREKDKRYYQRIMGEGVDNLKLRELTAFSHLDVKLLEKSGAERPKIVKELTDFLVNRGRTVGSKNCLFAKEAHLFAVCIENNYFSTMPMSLQTFSPDFLREYDAFQPKIAPVENMDTRDNIYLFNTIRIRDPEKVALGQACCEGGFSKIYISLLQFYYAQSANPVVQAFTSKPRSASRKKWVQVESNRIYYLKKTLAIKVSKDKQNYDKIAHEKQIVKHFRVDSSPYLVKYYHSIQNQFQYRNCLLMDFMGNVPTLSEFIQSHSRTFSLNSKMHILINLSAALKFLDKHQIVHMDLSSLNVMVVNRLMPKIIDFGEAYHEVLDKDSPNKYNPGHTMPYAPPETFQTIKKFKCSSDMFSFGIILFRIMMNDFPFVPSEQLKLEYESKSYMRRFMFAPEKMAELGWNRQNKLLMMIVERCLRQDESQRPIPYWLCVILTKIFQSLR